MRDDDDALSPELLLRAYASGIFPMAEHRDDPEIFWVDPRRRGVLPLDGFHLSRSLARRMRRGGYRAEINRRFGEVMHHCADRAETWINAEIVALCHRLHQMGHAHSFEIVSDDGALIGGVYGITLGAAFFGESMFSRRTDGSKLALAHLVEHLRRRGFILFDTQFLTDHLASLGAVEITRAEYHLRLQAALSRRADFDPGGEALPDPAQVLQRMIQTS